MLITSGDFIKLIQEQDPDGKRLVSFRVYEDGELVTDGEVEAASVLIRNLQQTIEGDKDVVRIDIEIVCGGYLPHRNLHICADFNPNGGAIGNMRNA